ncbi:TPR-like protein [Periconia macrospinosa]|uniref:TPR-like protein n=1 Tax=Periconia macrospinosa TaxID=97972 RepID=A0A2V1D2T4_9PLEO|nr:TPR-like protein [Periconia macrospinosa]
MSELEMRAQSLQSLLSDLYRLSFKIRNTRLRGFGSKALAFKQFDKETDVNIFSVYEALDRRHIYEHLSSIRHKEVTKKDLSIQDDLEQTRKAQWPALNEGCVEILAKRLVETFPHMEKDFLAHRLALANTHRRQHFAYWRRHALKLSKDHDLSTKIASPDPLGAAPSKDPLPSRLLPVAAKPGLSPFNQIAPTIISGTDATRFDPKIEDKLDTETVISYATTAYGLGGDSVELPPPPPDVATESEFLCQLCHVICPSKQGKQKGWRAHVLHDLQPYICTYPECAAAETLYSSRTSWLEHERIVHRRVWQCHEHSSCVFKSKAAFQEHLTNEHDNLTETHAQQLASFAEATVSDDRTKCPFCFEPGPFSNGLHNHMAFHQEQIATFSLPRDIQSSNDDALGSSKAQGIRSGGALRSVSLEFDNGSILTASSAKLEEKEKARGPDHTSEPDTDHNLGLLCHKQGKLDEAEEMLRRALEGREKTLGKQHRLTLTSMCNLASVLQDQGKYDAAEEMNWQVLKGREIILGPEHPDTLTSMANLASTCKNQGRWKEAEELEVQVVETRKTVLGMEHLDTLDSMANLALTYREQWRWKEAEELFVQMIETSKKVLGADHPSTLSSMANLASTYRNQGRWKDAEELEVQVMETSKTKLGADHPDTLTSMANLASTYWKQGQWADAEALEVQVMETSKTKLGADHPDTLSSMANLASTYSNQGRWEAAEALEVEVMETSKKVLGADHPDTLSSMANLASTYSKQGRWGVAEALEVEVIERSKTKLGADHPDMLSSMANLASTYSKQGRWEAAEALEVEVMETRKTVLGEEHPLTLSSMNNLAFTWKGQGYTSKAVSLMDDCCKRRAVVLGPQHPDTISSHETLTTWRLEDTALGK